MKRNLFRILAMLLALVMVMCAVGCSKGENSTGSVENTQSTSYNDVTTGGDNADTTVPEGDEPELYMLDGVWRFHETLVNPLPEDERAAYNGGFEQEIDFVTNGIVCCEIAWSYFGVFDWQNIILSSTDDLSGLILLYMDEKSTDKWERDYMELDFGDVPQEVSEEFYHWFTTNATKQ